MSRFSGKVAIVTGASTGLGPIMARMLAVEGAKVLLAARRLELVEEAARAIGPAAIAVQADVTDEADVARMVGAAMAAWGSDLLVVGVAIVEGDADNLAMLLPRQVGLQIAHRQAPIAQQLEQPHLSGERRGRDHQPTQGCATRRRLIDLVVHEDGNVRHAAQPCKRLRLA